MPFRSRVELATALRWRYPYDSLNSAARIHLAYYFDLNEASILPRSEFLVFPSRDLSQPGAAEAKSSSNHFEFSKLEKPGGVFTLGL